MHPLIGLVLLFCGTTALGSASIWYTGRFKGEILARTDRNILLGITALLLAFSVFLAVTFFPNGVGLG